MTTLFTVKASIPFDHIRGGGREAENSYKIKFKAYDFI